MTVKKQPPKTAPQSAESIVQQIEALLVPLKEAADKINEKKVEIDAWMEAHPELTELQRAFDQLVHDYADAQQPITALLGSLQVMDASRFSQEMKRIKGLRNGN